MDRFEATNYKRDKNTGNNSTYTVEYCNLKDELLKTYVGLAMQGLMTQIDCDSLDDETAEIIAYSAVLVAEKTIERLERRLGK